MIKITWSYQLSYKWPLLDIWIEEAPGKTCKIRDGYDAWGDLVKDQASCQAQCEIDSQCIGISYSHNSVFKDWCFICHEEELWDGLSDHGFGFYRRLGIIFTVILLWFTRLLIFSSVVFVADFKTLLFHIGIYSSAPTTTAQSTKPESADHSMTLMIVIHLEWWIDVLS